MCDGCSFHWGETRNRSRPDECVYHIWNREMESTDGALFDHCDMWDSSEGEKIEEAIEEITNVIKHGLKFKATGVALSKLLD